MLKIPKKVADRMRAEISRYRSIAVSHRDRGVSEADTVTVVKDMLADIFGYDKYTELTSEQQIRGTFCDLAVKIDGNARFLIEVKAAGTELNDGHLRQVVNYGAHHGIEWLVLTNGLCWRIYRLRFAQPIEYDLISEFELTTVDPDSDADRLRLFLLCREGLDQEAMTRFHRQGQQLNRFTIAQVIQTEPVMKAIRAQFRKLFGGLKLKEETLVALLQNEILRADLTEGEKAAEAQRLVTRADKKRAKRKRNDSIATNESDGQTAAAASTEESFVPAPEANYAPLDSTTDGTS